MDAFNHCNDTSRSNDERILACSQAAHAQGVTPDEQSFAYVDLGLAYDGKGDHDDAVQALSSAVNLEPDLWQGYFNRGQVYVEQGNPDAALTDYDRLVQIDPAKVAMYRSMIADYRTLPEGESTNMSSSEREAAAQKDAIARLGGEVANGFAYRCQQREMAGAQSLAAALTDCDQSLLLAPGSAKVLELRGVVHMQRNEFAAGHADFDAAVKIDPKSADALYLRGLSERSTGDTKAATVDMAAAMAIDPQVARKFVPAKTSHQ